MRRVIQFSHLSSLERNKLIASFTTPEGFKQWLCSKWDRVERNPQRNEFSIQFGQDHFIILRIRAVTQDEVHLRQVWMGEDEIDISIKLQATEKGTQITVALIGDITPVMEKEYLADWQALRLLP